MSLIKRFTQISLVTLIFCSQWALAQDFNWAPEFPVGSTIPVLEAPDQNGDVQTLSTLSGEKGVILMFSRSFDW